MHHDDRVALIAALVLAIASLAGCDGGATGATAVMCGDPPASLEAISAELEQADGEAGLAVFGATLTGLPDDLRDLDVSGDLADARDRAVMALEEMQAARAARELDEEDIRRAAAALRLLDERLC